MTAVIPADVIRAQIKAAQAAQAAKPGALDEFVAKVDAFVDEVMIPLEPKYLQGSFKAMKPDMDKARSEAKKRGLWAPWIPKNHGGLGLTLPEYARVSAALGRSPIAHYALNCQAPDVGNMELLMTHGTDEQRARWLAPLVEGSIRSCFSMTEPEFAGSNPVWMETKAVRDGADYLITGHKWFTSAADGSTFAIVMAVTNPDAKPHEHPSNALPASAPVLGVVTPSTSSNNQSQVFSSTPDPGPQCEPTSHMPAGNSAAGRPAIMRRTPAGSTSWKPGGTS